VDRVAGSKHKRSVVLGSAVCAGVEVDAADAADASDAAEPGEAEAVGGVEKGRTKATHVRTATAPNRHSRFREPGHGMGAKLPDT
jgi:hypothetical protein